jgi:hypothetical protein
MSDTPIAYAIVQDVQAALQAMTVAGGYFYTVPSGAVKLDPEHQVEARELPDGLRPFILIELSPLAMEFSDARGGEVVVTQPLVVHWCQDIDSTDDNALLQTFLRGCADVERALTQDITRGGRAVDTRVTGCELKRVADGSGVWADVAVDIRGWRTYGVPTESA